MKKSKGEERQSAPGPVLLSVGDASTADRAV